MVAMLQAHRHNEWSVIEDCATRFATDMRGTRGVFFFFFFSFSKSVGFSIEEKDRRRFFFRWRKRTRTRGSARNWHYGRSFERKNDPLGGVILIMRVDRRFVPALFSFSPCPRRREACEHRARAIISRLLRATIGHIRRGSINWFLLYKKARLVLRGVPHPRSSSSPLVPIVRSLTSMAM